MSKTIIGTLIGFFVGILTGFAIVSYAHLKYKKGLQVWSIRRKFSKVKRFIKSITGIVYSALYRIVKRKKVEERQEALYSFLERFGTVQELKFLEYICEMVIESQYDYKEIRLPSREDLREVLKVGKNVIPGIINSFENKGIIRVASNFSESLNKNKGGNNQAVFVLIDKLKAVELLELSEMARKTNMIESKRTPSQKFPRRLKSNRRG